MRLLDPPLHEFLPHDDGDIASFAKAAGIEELLVRRRLDDLHEMNPMLGHRGCRLGITYPEIYEMQARAIFEAAVAASKDSGQSVIPEVMIPLVGARKELDILRAKVEAVAKDVFEETGTSLGNGLDQTLPNGLRRSVYRRVFNCDNSDVSLAF